MQILEIEGCIFPDDLLFDVDEHVWVRVNSRNSVTIGITAILSALAGKLLSIKFKPVGSELQRGRSVATIEGLRCVAAVRTPVSGTLTEVNSSLVLRPKTVNDSPYDDGWFTELTPRNLDDDVRNLSTVRSSQERILSEIKSLHVRCFKAYPDHEMYEIGVECAAVLARLNELMEKITMGEVVHVVSDDPTAYFEMVRWSDQTGQRLVESREEVNLRHFIVRKVI